MADVKPLKLVDQGDGAGRLEEFGAADKVPAENLPATEWAAETVSQAEAEAGTATARRAWTALRVWQAVLASSLTGLNLTVGTAVAAADTVLVAIGKLQKQITDAATGLAGNVRATVLTGFVTGSNASVVNTDSVLAAFGKVQAQMNAKQTSHANLTALSGLAGVADRLPYFTGAGALSLTTLTGLARNLLDDTTQSGMQSTLGLVKQTSATDTTAGALMAAGAFGLGGNAVFPANADAITTSGFYMIASGNAGTLPSSAGSLLHIERGSSNSAVQIFDVLIASTVSSTWIRTRNSSGNWTPNQRIVHSQNILGAVSQSGGVPTGAIIERGSNANGEYVRWADGTQICTNSNNAIATNPATFTGTVTDIDGSKLRVGRWY